MATSAPTIQAYGDWLDIAVHAWGQRIVELGLFSGGELKYHLGGDDPGNLIDLPFKGTKESPDLCVIGDIMHIVWSQYKKVYYARWNLKTRTVHSQPVTITAGSLPKVACFNGTRLIVLYLSTNNEMISRNSLDSGNNWSTPTTVDPGLDIDNVSISISESDTSQYSWANNQPAPPQVFSESFQDQDWDEVEVSAADFTTPDFTYTDDFDTGWATVTDPTEPFDFSTPTASLSDDLSTW